MSGETDRGWLRTCGSVDEVGFERIVLPVYAVLGRRVQVELLENEEALAERDGEIFLRVVGKADFDGVVHPLDWCSFQDWVVDSKTGGVDYVDAVV